MTRSGAVGTGPEAEDPAIVDFLAALRSEQALSSNTVAAYRRDVLDLAARLRCQGRLLVDARPEDIVDWMEALRKSGRRGATVTRRLAAARSFFRYLGQEGKLNRDPTEHVERPRSRRPLPKTLSGEATAALIEAPDTSL